MLDGRDGDWRACHVAARSGGLSPRLSNCRSGVQPDLLLGHIFLFMLTSPILVPQFDRFHYSPLYFVSYLDIVPHRLGSDQVRPHLCLRSFDRVDGRFDYLLARVEMSR